MTNRDGKNPNKAAKTQPANDNVAPFYEELMEQKKGNQVKQNLPGPGQYQVATGFDRIQKTMNQVQHLKTQGLESFGINVIKNSCNFASKANRFEYKELRDKSMLPGPGAYTHEVNKQRKNGNVQSLSQGKFSEKHG